jgi:putative endonuclease
MQRHNDRMGKLGESEAVSELERLGYRILARRYSCRGGEADIVARDGETIAFVEVKARGSFDHGLPREAVGYQKQCRLALAAAHYCAEKGIEDRPLRFDVVEVVVLGGRITAIELIKNAFVPDD